MSRKDGPSRFSSGEMRFFDEAEAETVDIGRLGRGEAGVYDAGYTDEEEESEELLEFGGDGDGRVDDVGEDDSGPARIFVGRAALPVGGSRQQGGAGGDASAARGAGMSLERDAASFDEDDSYGDEYDEFDDEPAPASMRVPPNAPGMRLLTPEREDSLNTDRAWPGLLPRADEPEPDAAVESRPSWLDALPPVQPRPESARSGAADATRDGGRAWDAPLLDFDDARSHRPSWADDGAYESDVIEAGDEEDAELPVHQPMAYGDDGYFAEEPLETAEPDDEEGVTGNWNRLAVLASADASEQPTTRFGVPPSPVWQAKDPEGAAAERQSAPGWDDSPAWFQSDSLDGDAEDDLDPGPALPPIQAMGSVLQQEINTRKPVQPKAVVLKTLDGVSAPPVDMFDEPSDLRSRVPSRDQRGGQVDAQPDPEPVETGGGYWRVLVLVAAAVLITVVAAREWGESLPADPETVQLQSPGDGAPLATVEPPELVAPTTGSASTAEPPAVPVATSAPTEAPTPVGPLPSEPVPVPSSPAVSVATAPTEQERTAEERRASREDRMRALQTGLLYVTTDSAAYVYVDGKRVARAPMEMPGLKLKPGHYDVRVVPRGRGRPYVTSTRVDAGRVRNIRVDFLARK